MKKILYIFAAIFVILCVVFIALVFPVMVSIIGHNWWYLLFYIPCLSFGGTFFYYYLVEYHPSKRI